MSHRFQATSSIRRGKRLSKDARLRFIHLLANDSVSREEPPAASSNDSNDFPVAQDHVQLDGVSSSVDDNFDSDSDSEAYEYISDDDSYSSIPYLDGYDYDEEECLFFEEEGEEIPASSAEEEEDPPPQPSVSQEDVSFTNDEQAMLDIISLCDSSGARRGFYDDLLSLLRRLDKKGFSIKRAKGRSKFVSLMKEKVYVPNPQTTRLHGRTVVKFSFMDMVRDLLRTSKFDSIANLCVNLEPGT